MLVVELSTDCQLNNGRFTEMPRTPKSVAFGMLPKRKALAAVLFENLLELGGDLRWQAAFDVLAGNKRHHFAVLEKRGTWARGRIRGRLTKRGGKGI